MIIRNPAQEAAWSISYPLFYILAAVATGMLIRAHPLPLLGAASFTQDFWYAIPLERIWGRLPAILVTTLLFTAWHLPTRFLLAHGAEGRAGDFVSILMGTGISVAGAGLIIGWIWDRNRNLPFLIALHAGIDTLPILSSLLEIQV